MNGRIQIKSKLRLLMSISLPGVSHVSCEPDVVQLLDSAANSNLMKTMNGKETTSTTIINNRPVTIKTFKLEPGMTLQNLPLPPGTIVDPPAKVFLNL